MCYNIINKGNRHEWLTSGMKGDLPYFGQSTGKVFTTLVTNQVNECQ